MVDIGTEFIKVNSVKYRKYNNYKQNTLLSVNDTIRFLIKNKVYNGKVILIEKDIYTYCTSIYKITIKYRDKFKKKYYTTYLHNLIYIKDMK